LCISHRFGEVRIGRNITGHKAIDPVFQCGKAGDYIVDGRPALFRTEVVDASLSTVCGEHQRDAPAKRTRAHHGYRSP
jgi:hypothetical protein